jgi:type II secretory ATPase GspE/PulE/Tfp pilus assembly ATPase PilB-like protein
MVMNDEIGAKVMERAPSPEVSRLRAKAGTRMLREDGWLKVKRGATTIDEVLMCTAV